VGVNALPAGDFCARGLGLVGVAAVSAAEGVEASRTEDAEHSALRRGEVAVDGEEEEGARMTDNVVVESEASSTMSPSAADLFSAGCAAAMRAAMGAEAGVELIGAMERVESLGAAAALALARNASICSSRAATFLWCVFFCCLASCLLASHCFRSFALPSLSSASCAPSCVQRRQQRTRGQSGRTRGENAPLGRWSVQAVSGHACVAAPAR
jgi:hypothetical protein